MNPLSAGDVFLTVAIMSVTFLAEVGVFILLGMFWRKRGLGSGWWPMRGLDHPRRRSSADRLISKKALQVGLAHRERQAPEILAADPNASKA
jgi:hypothetical protein